MPEPLIPGSLSKKPIIPPILCICSNWVSISSRLNVPPFWSFFAIFSALSLSILRSTSSTKDNTSPIPKIRCAIRSGWNGSSASSFSPIPKNLIGLPVMARTESAAPPRASPSVLVRITPVSGKASLKAFAVFAASCPVIASTTNNVSVGLIAACSSLISSIMSSSTCKRPAVSTINTSANLILACSIARLTMVIGLSEASDAIQSTPTSCETV